MNVLKTLKGAINNAQQVGSSIKSSKSKKKGQPPRTYAGVEGVDIDAGGELLNKFQDQWSDMHQHAEHNAKAAQKVDVILRSQFEKCERQTGAMNNLMSLSATLPHLLEDITKLTETVGALQKQFQHVETALVTMVDVDEAVAMRTNQLHHHRQLSEYTFRKMSELEKIKVTLADEHSHRVARYEATLQEHLRMKQEVFEEAFAKEMQNYRESGSTDMRPRLTRTTEDVELADISIEQDNSALDAFLDSDGEAGGSSSDTPTIEDEEDDKEEDEEENRFVPVGIITNDISDPEFDASLEIVGEHLQAVAVEEISEKIKTSKIDSTKSDNGDDELLETIPAVNVETLKLVNNSKSKDFGGELEKDENLVESKEY